MDAPPPSPRERSLRGVQVLLGLLALMWVVQVVNSLDGYALSRDEGILPRSESGLPGIAFSPFLHESWTHLIGNTIPFVVLGLMIAIAGPARLLAVTAIVALVAGLGTWLTSPSNSDTVGASGVVFGYAGYLVARGFFNRRLGEIALGALVVVLFGGALLASLVPHAGVSWEAHAFGAVGGVLAARVFADDAQPAPASASANVK